MAVKNNDSIVIDYTLTNTTDSKFVSSGATFQIQLGRGAMLPGFESGMVGLTINETKTITLTAANAWGEYDTAKQQICPSLGAVVGNSNISSYPIGSVIPSGGEPKIIGLTATSETTAAMLDFNNPLAGKDLSLEVTLKEIKTLPTE